MKTPILIWKRVAEMDFHKFFFAPVFIGGLTITSESENNSFLSFTEELFDWLQRDKWACGTLCPTGIFRLEIWKTAQRVTLLESEKS